MPKKIQVEEIEVVNGKQEKKMVDALEKTVSYTNISTKKQLEKLLEDKVKRIERINEAYKDNSMTEKMGKQKQVLLDQVQKEIDEINQDLTYFKKK